MEKMKLGKKDLDSYAIKGTNKVVKAADCVLMRPSDSDKPPYVAWVEKIEADHRNNIKVRVRWYYRPEESIGGRRQFHEAKELFLFVRILGDMKPKMTSGRLFHGLPKVIFGTSTGSSLELPKNLPCSRQTRRRDSEPTIH